MDVVKDVAMVVFKNPDSPTQPRAGVYGWFAEKGEKRIDNS